MRPILIILFFLLLIVSAKSQAQKWQPGHFTDVKGTTTTGLIRLDPSNRGPVKGEGFIEFKENSKANLSLLSAGSLQSVTVGRDSFVVAHAPANETFAKNEVDFLKVVLNEDIKLYATNGGKTNGRHGFSISPGIGIGIGTGFGSGGFGAGVGGEVEIPLGHGGGNYGKTIYYYGENPGQIKKLTEQNFADVMTDIMGDEPDVVEKIVSKVYVLENIEQLIVYFKQVKAARTTAGN